MTAFDPQPAETFHVSPPAKPINQATENETQTMSIRDDHGCVDSFILQTDVGHSHNTRGWSNASPFSCACKLAVSCQLVSSFLLELKSTLTSTRVNGNAPQQTALICEH